MKAYDVATISAPAIPREKTHHCQSTVHTDRRQTSPLQVKERHGGKSAIKVSAKCGSWSSTCSRGTTAHILGDRERRTRPDRGAWCPQEGAPARVFPRVTGTRLLRKKAFQVTSAPCRMPIGMKNMLATECCPPRTSQKQCSILELSIEKKRKLFGLLPNAHQA